MNDDDGVFNPLKLRDWKEMNTFYKKPEAGPSDARIAGENLLKYCDQHIEPVPIDRYATEVVLPKDLYQEYSNNKTESQDSSSENQNYKEEEDIFNNDRCFEVSTDDGNYSPPASTPRVEEP